jgi:hypothetical protein
MDWSVRERLRRGKRRRKRKRKKYIEEQSENAKRRTESSEQ